MRPTAHTVRPLYWVAERLSILLHRTCREAHLTGPSYLTFPDDRAAKTVYWKGGDNTVQATISGFSEESPYSDRGGVLAVPARDQNSDPAWNRREKENMVMSYARRSLKEAHFFISTVP
jgi:hypothetical protein